MKINPIGESYEENKEKFYYPQKKMKIKKVLGKDYYDHHSFQYEIGNYEQIYKKNNFVKFSDNKSKIIEIFEYFFLKLIVVDKYSLKNIFSTEKINSLENAVEYLINTLKKETHGNIQKITDSKIEILTKFQTLKNSLNSDISYESLNFFYKSVEAIIDLENKYFL